MQYRKKFTVVILSVTILVIGWITLDFKASEVPFISVEDLLNHHSEYYQDQFRLGGNVHSGSIKYSKDKLTVKFIMDQGEHNLPVIYTSAALPDLFSDDADVIVVGSYTDGVLVADNLMTKCASRYEEESNYTSMKEK